MTLNTHVYIHDSVDPKTLFHFCRSMLGCQEHHTWVDQPWYDQGTCIYNHGGQGLPAWLMVHYRAGEPLHARADACTSGCEPEEDSHYHLPAHWLRVSLDTAYSYQDQHGGCGALHARIVFALGQWLDERGITWSWRNEFTGQVHQGEDRYTRLAELAGGGDQAKEWLLGTVLPAVERLSLERGKNGEEEI